MEHILPILGIAIASGLWVLLQRSSQTGCNGSCGACGQRGQAEGEPPEPGSEEAPARGGCKKRSPV